MDVDVSSYPKPTAGPNFLDTAGKYQNLESNKISIDQQKLKLMNDQFQLINQELSTIADNPSVTKEEAAKRLNTFADTYKLPPPVRQHMIGELTSAPNAQSFAKNALQRGMDTQQRINKTYGVPGSISNGQQVTPTLQRTGEGPVAAGLPIQVQAPPTTEVATPGGTQQLGPQQPQIPVGAAPAGTGIPGQMKPSLPTTGPMRPAGPMTSQPPLFESGKAQLAQDQALATERMTAVKPALQALPLLEGLRTGPTTEGFNKVVAALKANGIIDTGANDPTAIYQEVSKKLAQYVGQSPLAARSDAGQALAEAASPSPKTQINPALIKLTKDAIILDRVQASRPSAFKDQDLSKYGQHRATYPQSIDEKAFGLDLMKPDESKKLVGDMAEKLKSKNAGEKTAAEKFFKSLRIAKEQGFYSGQ